MKPLGLLVLAAILATSNAHAQRRTSWSIMADNDYFNFWQPVAERPDAEYTQGFHLSAAFPIAPRRLPRWLPSRLVCSLFSERCPWLTLGLSQEIYTPAVDGPVLLPGQRPYAGWLAVHAGVGRHTMRDLEQLELTVGMTGPPSLAEFAQTRLHRLLGYREPLGWSGQIPLEPGFFLAYTRAREVWTTDPWQPLGIRIGLLGQARTGTARIDGSARASATFGLHPAAPRPIDLTRRTGRMSLHASVSAQLDGVLRNEFIQGTLLRDSPGIPIRSLVTELSAGAHLRLGRVVLSWSGNRRGREYPMQPGPHTYSSLGIALTP